MRTCSRCKQVKPEESFRKYEKHDRLDSHCWHCRRQVANASKRRYPHQRAEHHMAERSGANDPVAHAYLVAKHVSTYVGNAIQRWERGRGSEAHPYLSAIKNLADELSAQALQQPSTAEALQRRHCEHCGTKFEPTGRSQRFCCKAHATKERERLAVLSGANAERCRLKYQRRKEALNASN